MNWYDNFDYKITSYYIIIGYIESKYIIQSLYNHLLYYVHIFSYSAKLRVVSKIDDATYV